MPSNERFIQAYSPESLSPALAILVLAGPGGRQGILAGRERKQHPVAVARRQALLLRERRNAESAGKHYSLYFKPFFKLAA
jgi:hypothetical protein